MEMTPVAIKKRPCKNKIKTHLVKRRHSKTIAVRDNFFLYRKFMHWKRCRGKIIENFAMREIFSEGRLRFVCEYRHMAKPRYFVANFSSPLFVTFCSIIILK